MASDNEASCESDPNFAVICAFMEKFGTTCGLQTIDFLELQEMLENTQEVHQELIDLHIKLFRKSRKTVSNERWEKAVIKFCHTFCVQDAWEIERFGYKKARLSSKLRVLKELLEMQFDYNVRFKAEINKMSAEELRSQPIGRDKQGHAYWFQNDNNCQIRVYKDDQDEETWTLVAKDRDGLASLISELSDGDSKFSSESVINEEDSNSLAEKPIIDTGQVDSSSDSNKKSCGDSENSNESSMKKEEDSNESSTKRDEDSNESSTKKDEDSNISAPGEADVPSDDERKKSGEVKEKTTRLKRPREEDDDDDDDNIIQAKKQGRIEEKIEVSEAIEEPVMLIRGEGSGESNEGVNPIVGEEIEEDLMYFYGAGNGVDCKTGNEDKPTSDGKAKQSGKNSERDTSDSGVVSISSESKNCVNDEVPTPPAVVKSPYKLGTIIDTKTDNKLFSSSTTVSRSSKKSRWDVEAIMAPPQETGRVKDLVNKWEQQIEVKEETPKKAMFFFGPGCLQFKPATVGFGQNVHPEAKENKQTEKQGDVGYRIEEDNKEETSDCVQSGSAGPINSRNEHQTPIDTLENDSDNVSAADVETKVDKDPTDKEISEKEVRIPEVTAALIGYEDKIHDTVKSSEENKRSADPQTHPVPVVEELCVKKHAYLLGAETSTKVVENHQKISSQELQQESETVIQSEVSDMTSTQIQVEKVSKIDENENKQVIEQVTKASSLEVSKDEDRHIDNVKSDDKVATLPSQRESEREVTDLKKQRDVSETLEVSTSGEGVESKSDNVLEISSSKQDDVIDVDMSKRDNEVIELPKSNKALSNCDEKVETSISKLHVLKSVEVSKRDEEISTGLIQCDEKIDVSKSKQVHLEERGEVSKLEVESTSKSDDTVEVSKLEVESTSKSDDTVEVALSTSNDDVDATVSKPTDIVESVKMSKCDDVVDTIAPKCVDDQRTEHDLLKNIDISKSGDQVVVESSESDDNVEIVSSKSDDKVDVALPTNSDTIEDLSSKSALLTKFEGVENLTSKSDDKAEIIKSDDKVGDAVLDLTSKSDVKAALPTKSDVVEDLTSKSDAKAALPTKSDVVEDLTLKSDVKAALPTKSDVVEDLTSKSDDKSEITKSDDKVGDAAQDLTLKSDDKAALPTKSDVVEDLTSKCEGKIEVALSKSYQTVEIATSPQLDVSTDNETSKLIDLSKSDKVEEFPAEKQQSLVDAVKCDEKVQVPLLKDSEMSKMSDLLKSDENEGQVSPQVVKCDEKTVLSKETEIIKLSNTDMSKSAEEPVVGKCDEKVVSSGNRINVVEKPEVATCDQKVEVATSSQHDATENTEITNDSVVNLQKSNDNVNVENAKSVEKVEENIVVSKPVEILKVSKSENMEISKSDEVVKTVSNCDDTMKETSTVSRKEIEEKLSVSKNLEMDKKSSESKIVAETSQEDVVDKIEAEETAKEESNIEINTGELEEVKSATDFVDDEVLPKPVEKSPKISMREVRRQTRRSAQKTKIESVDINEKPPALVDPMKETILIDAKKTPDKSEAVTKKAFVYLKTEDKIRVDEKTLQMEETPKTSTKRGRKNNSSEPNPEDEKKPRVAVTRRNTRSSKNAESFEESVVDEKPIEVVPAKPRRGRPKKVAKEATNEESSKKIKLSNETPEAKRSLRSHPKVEKDESKEASHSKEKEDNDNQMEQSQGEKVEEENVEAKEAERKVEIIQDQEEIIKDGEAKDDEKKIAIKDEEKGEVKSVDIEEDEKKVEDKEDVVLNEEEKKVEVKETNDKIPEEVGSPMSEISMNDAEPFAAESGNSSEASDKEQKPEEEEEEEEEKESASKPMSLATFSLDFTESPVPTPPLTRRGLRKRGRESPHEEVEETVGKRPKMKAKRVVDAKLRKSIEDQKKKDLISSDEDSKSERVDDKTKKHAKKSEESIVVSSDADKEPRKKKSRKNKNERLLSNLGIDPQQALELEQIGVRQSRRIAQLKIREEAERRKLEDEMTYETHKKKKKKKSKKSEDKDYKVEKNKSKQDVEDDELVEEDSNDSKKKLKKKKKKHRKLFDELNPWRSSSDSSSSAEEDEIGDEEEDEDEDVLQYVSDHEFSPESDMEDDGEAQPLKRARTARKESDVEEVDDCPCQRCSKSDHPEWILLCDSCDNGWHCSCLRPPLLVIPEGDWFCPPCQHASLLTKLTEKLTEYDKTLKKKEVEDRRKQRLAYVGISLNSVLPAIDTENIRKRIRHSRDDDDGDEASSEESDSGSSSESESGSDSDEPIYQLRQRRQAHSYRFNDFDELINSAIQDEMDAVKGAGNQGRGKDIATIVNAEKEEERKKEAEKEQEEVDNEEDVPYEYETLPPVVPLDDKDKEAKPMFETDEAIEVKKKIVGRKKHRKLNALDISSADDDGDSDEDFKGTSSESDDDFDDDLGSEDTDELDNGRGRRKGMDPVRRSTRARTSRFDADFIDDGESDSDDAPRRKKKRSIWDESESEESDRSWGRRRRKPTNRARKPTNTPKKKKSKKKKKRQDSDEEVYKKKKPKIKFGLDADDDGPVRRTRGKKITYVDALGSDTDEERVKRPPPRIDSDEEYVANEDDVAEDEKLSEAESGDDNSVPKDPKIQIQSYTDARFTQLLPEPKNVLPEDLEGELNPIDQINRNMEMMDENEMEKMMEEEEYANKQLQMVAQQLEKEKRRKEREAKMQQSPMSQLQQEQKKRARKPPKEQFLFSGPIQEPLVGNVDNLLLNSENNDELSEPPGVSLPLFAELGGHGDGLEDSSKKRRGKTKKSLEEAVANLGSARQHDAIPPFMTMANKSHATDLSMPQDGNIEIAAPPQPFSQSQPTPSVITRMLQSKSGYPVGSIRPKQFATMPADDDHAMTSPPPGPHPGQYVQGSAGMRPQLGSPYRQMAPSINHFSRTGPPPQMRTPVPHMYHPHRSMDPSPSGGGAINMSDHNSPGRVVSPAASSPGSNKNETPPPPPYSRPPPGAPPPSRFPMTSPGTRHVQQMVQHLQPNRSNLSPFHPQYHYGQFGQEDALPPAMFQGSPYAEAAFEGQLNPSEGSNSKGFEDESGGEFGGLVSYFSSQREDDLES